MGNVHMEATQINYRGGSKKMSVEEAIKAAGTEITPEEKTWIDSIPALTTSNSGKTDQDVIAPEFDAEAGVYAIGDKVMYEGKLYKFTTAHETPGDWDSTEVSETTVDDELSSLESGLTNLSTAQVVGADGEISDRLSTATAIDNFLKSLYNKKGFYHFSYYDANKESTFATAINSVNGFCFVLNSESWLNHPLAFVFEGGMDAFIVMFEITNNSYSVLLVTKLARSS